MALGMIIDRLISGIWDDLFNVFLYGDGAWLGLICIMAISILVSAKVKFSGILFTFVCIFMGITYFNNIPIDSYFMWIALITWITGLWCLLLGIWDVKKGR